MTRTPFLAAESIDPKQCVTTSLSHLEEKMVCFLCLVWEQCAGPRGRCLSSQQEGWVTCPGCADEPLPSPVSFLRGGRSPAASVLWAYSEQVKMATATLFLEGSSFCAALPARPGASGRPDAGGSRGHSRCSPAGGRLGALPGVISPPGAALVPAWHCGVTGSPLPSALPRPVLSAFPLPESAGCVWSPAALLRGQPRRGSPGGAEQQRSPSRLVPRGIYVYQWVYGSIENSQGRMCLDFGAILGRNSRKRESE